MNDFERRPDSEIQPDAATLRRILFEVAALAMVHEVEVYISNKTARSTTKFGPLSATELDQAIENLSVGMLVDIREFEHREGLREGLQLVVDRVNELLAQASGPQTS
ncbi:hypothetical protein HYW36_02255 [Candidatus Saccharibacteria bacterium]|nr:hypothetical protein [Candidatus Saccharibacteria bacterium]